MKIKVFGYQGKFSSTERIKKMLVERGFELSERPEWIIDCNGLFAEAEEFANSLDYKPKKLYNLLDVDTSKDFSFYKNTEQHLKQATVVCAISNVVKDQIEKYFDVKNVKVIGFPTREVSYLKNYKTIDFIYIGRVYSPNKRFYLTKDTLRAVKYPREERGLIVAGMEPPQTSYFLKEPDDYALNELYNSAKYVFHPSSFEGLGLSAIEGVICGCFPLVCSDNLMVDELGLQDFASAPNGISIGRKIQEIEENLEEFTEKLVPLREKYLKQFTLSAVCDKIEELL